MTHPLSPQPPSPLAGLGFLRIAAATPPVRIADVASNTLAIIQAIQAAAGRGCRLVVLPELCITGYSCADLFYQSLLREQACAALQPIAAAARDCGAAVLVGLPLEAGGRLYNCAALLCAGRVAGVVPKTYLPTTGEFYEERWFTPASPAAAGTVRIAGVETPFGADLLFCDPGAAHCVFGVELCEDVWSVNPPSGDQALAGATVLLNPSASNELLGKAEYRRDLVRQQSARCLAAYVYAGSGPGESTTDVVYSGHSMIAENGIVLAEAERFRFDTQLAVADIDLERLANERLKNSSFSAAAPPRSFRRVDILLPEPAAPAAPALLRGVPQTPFVPSDTAQRARHCREIFSIQSTGLARRLMHTGARTVAIGISGGLDSTLALLVTLKAFDVLRLDRAGILAITMPGFGTTARTRDNAGRLAGLIGVTLRCIPIVDAVRQHFRDIGHDESIHDVTYENAQARERTQILMDVANQAGGFVVGTGDLSELALGWATFNGDHMSMYHVNAGVPKTLVRYLIEWAAEAEFAGETAGILRDICATPITPELLPLGEGNTLQQETEATIGPYLLHDFFLFYTVRYAFAPRKVFFLARQAFKDAYPAGEILKWMDVFYRRFFAQQFKRSAMPDGPKVGSVALSPRGDWRMPSDASSALWRREIEELKTQWNG